MTLIFRRIALGVLVAGSLASMSACIPLVPLMIGGGAVMGAMVVADRRTSGAQLEDEGIEIRANSRLRENVGDRVHVNVTSYNRKVLLTGEVPSVQDKQLVEQIVARVDNVQSVANELEVSGNSTFTQRSSDTLVTGKAKAALVDAKDLMASAFKLVTERGTMYMMGRVTQREANRATDVVRGVSGVQKVVRLLEIISEEELARVVPPPPADNSKK